MKKVKNMIIMSALIVIITVSLSYGGQKKYVLNMGSAASPQHSYSRVAKKFIEMVETESGERIRCNWKAGGVVGGEREIVEAVQMGFLEAGWVSDIGLSVVVPDIGYVLLPYLFPTYDSVDKYYFNGFIGEDIKKKLSAKGIRVLGFLENDFRGLTNSKQPIRKVEDLKGLKIRVPELPLFISLFSKLGAIPTPMSITELATGLQQKTVDGQDNGVIITMTNGYQRMQGYMTLTKHMYSGGAIVINEDLWQGMSDDLKGILLKAVDWASKEQIEMNRADVLNFIEEMKAAGVQIDELTPEEHKKFINVGRSLWDDFEDKYSKKWIDRLKNEAN